MSSWRTGDAPARAAAPLGADGRRVAPTDSAVPHARGSSTWMADDGEPWLGRAVGMEGRPRVHVHLAAAAAAGSAAGSAAGRAAAAPDLAHDQLYMQIWTDPSRNHVYACLCDDGAPHGIDGADAPALPPNSAVAQHASSAAHRRLFVHYGIGAQNVCAYAAVTHAADVCVADKIPIANAAVMRAYAATRRSYDDSAFDAVSALLLRVMRSYVKTRANVGAPETWAEDPIMGAIARATPIAGYSFWHHNCRTFVYWLLSTVLGLDAESVLDKMVHDCKFSMGLPGSMLYPFYEMDAFLGFFMVYKDRIMLNIIREGDEEPE